MPLCLPICDANRHCWSLPRSNNSLGMAKWWHFHFTSPSSFISWNNCWCTITYSLVAGKYDQVHLKNIRINNPITAFQRIELIFHHLPKGNISFFSLFSITMNFYIFDVFPFTTFNNLIVLQIFTFGHWESIDISSESFCFLTGSPASSSGWGSPVQFLLLPDQVLQFPKRPSFLRVSGAVYNLHPGLHVATGLVHVSRSFQ